MRLVEETVRPPDQIRSHFESAYPNLSLDLACRMRRRSGDVWTATVREKSHGHIVSLGVRHYQSLAIGAALSGIPERFRRTS
ncbi:MAG TPA: hypothetical protein VIA45_11635 [Thermoanaerobaculia bacterium]|jgi:hypothetical protein